LPVVVDRRALPDIQMPPCRPPGVLLKTTACLSVCAS
jgi:hypothetical protein